MTLQIITNNQEREIVYGHELPIDNRDDFDYLNDEKYQFNEFIVYRGTVYDLNQFMRVAEDGAFKDWDGVHGETAFSGVLVKIVDSEFVIMGRYMG